MRRRLTAILALGLVSVIGVAAVAVAARPTVVQAGKLVLKINGGVTPKALPKNRLAPIRLKVAGNVSTRDGTHPPATKTIKVDFDKHGTVNARGLPVCRAGQLNARPTKEAERACKNSIVGKGQTLVEVEFPEQKPFTAKGPLVLFNGGTKGGKTTLYIHAYVAVPAPTAIVTTVTIKKIRKGRYGLRTVAKVPRIAGGSGSVLSFNLRVKRIFRYKGKKQSYVNARCSDGKFAAKVIAAIFKDEAGTGAGNVKLSGTVIRPCTPKG